MKDGTPNYNAFNIHLKSGCCRLCSMQGNTALALDVNGFHKFVLFEDRS